MNKDHQLPFEYYELRIANRVLRFSLCALCVLCGSFSLAKAEVKAVWVRPFVGASDQARRNPRTGRGFIRKELERIRRAGLNTVYVEAFWSGYSMYRSRLVPMRPLEIPYGIRQKDYGWDVLDAYIEEGRRLNLKIHAWLHIFYQWNSSLGGLEKSPIFSANPDWAILNSSGSPLVKSEAEGANRDIYKVFMSPSNPGVRKYLRGVVAELADRYSGLGGIQFDYIRYPLHAPDELFDYNPATLAQFQKETGLDARKLSAKGTPKQWRTWQDWKTRQVTEVVKQLAEIVRKRQPKWEISAAVFPDFEENLRVKMQDSQDWARRGLIDALLPMLYSTDFARVEKWAREFKAGVPPKTKIYPAIFIGHFYDAKAKTLDERYLQLPSNLKFDGVGLFAAQSLTEDLVEKLAKKN